MVDGLSMVGRGRSVVGRGMSLVAGLVLVVVGLSLVPDVHHIAGVAVSGVVGNDLGPAVGKGNTVLANGGIAIPVLILAKVGARVAVLDSVLEVVGGVVVISGLMVGRLGGMVGGGVVDRGSMVDSMVHGGMVGSMVTEGNSRKGSESNEDLHDDVWFELLT